MHLVQSSKLAQEINIQNSADDWLACVICSREYRPAAIGTDGACLYCKDAARAEADRLKSILGNNRKAYELHTLERFEVTDENRSAFQAVQAFDFKRDSLYLFGDCGVGKSHLATLLIRRAVKLGLSSIIHSEPSDMLRVIQAAALEGADNEQRAINRFVSASLFVLDDLGTERITDFRLQLLYEVINGRDKNMLGGLVITSNFDLGKIAKRLNDDRISSRIAGMCKVIKIGGKDYRISTGPNSN